MKRKMQRWWDIPAALFLVAALLSASARLQTTNWTENLGRVSFIVFLGAALGFALGKSIFPGRITLSMGLVYSLFAIPWQLGLLIPVVEWPERMSILYARMWYATSDFIQNNPVKDPILFLCVMMVLYWFASLVASYRLVRRADPWVPLLSLGVMILVIEYTVEMYRSTTPPGNVYSLLYLIFCLLLLGRVYFLRSRKDWEERGGTIEMEVGYDLGRGVAVAAVVIALLAWNTPRIINFFDYRNPARERVSQSWQTFRDRISKAVNSLRSSNPVEVHSYGSNMYLGTGGDQSEEVQFFVRPENGRQDNRVYWAARTYDEYRGGQWLTTIGSTQPVGPSYRMLVYPSWAMRRQVQFTFISNIPLSRTLYYTNELLTVSRAAQAIVSVDQDGLMDLNTIVLDPPLESGEQYTIRSQVPIPTILALREAGEEYPDFISQRYLQMPSNFSPRIVELAKQIAGEEETSYDKAMAITQYLRRTITYSVTVPDPPRNREPLEWFLFDLRSGFCNYYASAEVMMLRALGIPARLVVGYAEGTWDPEQATYIVLGKDSHAWPEVYFPKLGWIAFEPTVSQPLNSFPEGTPAEAVASGNTAPEPEPTFDPRQYERNHGLDEGLEGDETGANTAVISGTGIAILAGALVVAALVVLEIRRRRTQDLPLPSWLEKVFDERGLRTPGWLRMWSRRALRTPMENLFANVGLMLRVWGQRIDPAHTPAEQVAMLVNVVPGVEEHALTLLEEYQRAMYSPYPANLLRAKAAVSGIRSIGYRNWIMRLVGLET
jgi:hypothetical protein